MDVLGDPFFGVRGVTESSFFGIMKELDPNFIDIKLQTHNFIGSKVISFQKNQKNPKK